MYSVIDFMYPCVRVYRRALVLKVLLILMFFVDVISFFIMPVWVSVLVLIVHAVVVVFWIRTKCQLLDAFLADLFE